VTSRLVRDAAPADAPGVAGIGRISVPETYRGICPPEVVDNIVAQSYALDALRDSISRCARADDGHFLVAEEDGRVVGFLHYDCEGTEPELHRIYLDPARMRRGIGTSLVTELHRRLPPGTTYVLMVVVANRPAVSFYRKYGCVERERIDGPTFMHDHMGVEFPPGTPEVPALLLEFTTKPG
jgi:ribosomal protein S18 acetylase RimI-like enzyme